MKRSLHLLLACLLIVGSASAQTLTTVVHFNTGAATGRYPQGDLTDDGAGNLYGTTQAGGIGSSGGNGTIFKITAGGSGSTLVSFTNNGATNKGRKPSGSLFKASDGAFYGTTFEGGQYFSGTVFKMQPDGTLQTLANFNRFSPPLQGSEPNGNVIDGGDGSLYGLTSSGGAAADQGTLFRITGSTVARVFDFGLSSTTYAGQPFGSLLRASDGNFYALTLTSTAPASVVGSIVKITPTGTPSIVVNFTGTAGAAPGSTPYGSLIEDNTGFLYGMTIAGGANDKGTIFKVRKDGTDFTNLVNFNGAGAASNAGAYPWGTLLLASDGNFYGTTEKGGPVAGYDNKGMGTLFQLKPDGTLTTLVEFNQTNGAYPRGSLIQASNGKLYGTTSQGGSDGSGTVFSMILPVPIVPEIAVSDAGTDRMSGSSVNFGNVVSIGQFFERSFLITNPGTAPLTLGTVTLDNQVPASPASIFTVTTAPAASVEPGASTTLTVRFTPAASGLVTTRLRIANNDADENPFTLFLSGNGNFAPVLTLPVSPLLVPATSAAGALVQFTVTATDVEDDPDPVPSVFPPSGTLFAIGDTTVNVSATDSAGLTTSDSFIVRVTAPQAPSVTTEAPTMITPTRAILHATVDASDDATTVTFYVNGIAVGTANVAPSSQPTLVSIVYNSVVPGLGVTYRATTTSSFNQSSNGDNVDFNFLTSDTNIATSIPFFYGANVGWINARPATSYGFRITETLCSGFLWCGEIGWIHAGTGEPADNTSYSNTAGDYGVNVLPDGKLRGNAWSGNVGWIAFEEQGNPHFDSTTGRLMGYAFNGNIGWINLGDNDFHAGTQEFAGTITTLTPSPITPTQATLRASVNPDGFTGFATFYLDDSQVDQMPVASSSTATTVSLPVIGLIPGSEHTCRVDLSTIAGPSVTGNTITFNAAGGPPLVTTTAPTMITPTHAVLHATVNPNSVDTVVTFYVGGIAVGSVNVPAGSSATDVTFNYHQVIPGQSLNFTANAVNNFNQIGNGATREFSLLPSDSTIGETDAFLYAANAGWINAKPATSYGFHTADTVCSGFLYAANIGWIHAGNGEPANGLRYSNTNGDYGVNLMPDGTLRGFAWSGNIGWIAFEDIGNPHLDYLTGAITGHAFSSNIGWLILGDLNFHLTTTQLAITDSDHDGLSDSWEIQHGGLGSLNADADSDQDGVSDYDEYLADSDPHNGSQRGADPASSAAPNGDFILTFSSSPNRLYSVEESENLAPPWQDIGLGWFPGSSSGSTTVNLGPPAGERKFFQVLPRRPLP